MSKNHLNLLILCLAFNPRQGFFKNETKKRL